MTTEDKSRKTEKPTPKKLRDVREKGSVIRSREIISTSIIIAVFLFFGFGWQRQLDIFKEIMVISTTLFEFPFDHALKRMLDLLLSEFYSIVFPFAATVIIVGVLANVLQFGVLFSSEPFKPKFERISPISGFKRIFSAQNLLESVKTMFKVIVLSIILYFVLHRNMESLVQIPNCGIDCLKGLLEHLAAKIAIYLTPFIIFLAIADYILQKRIFMRSQMMTKDETRRERRDLDGDPHLMSQRKRLHQEIAAGGIVEAMQNASLVITAGEDIAVVLYYDKENTPLPVITAIGRYQMARQIIDIGHRSTVPVQENSDLATGLAEHGKPDQYIPSEYIDKAARALHEAGK